MEKSPPDTDRTIETDHDISPRSSKMGDENEKGGPVAVAVVTTKAEQDDPTTDYSSKATNKTSMKDYVVWLLL